MEHKFKVGDRVGEGKISYNTYEGCVDGVNFGVVTNVTSTGQIVVTWDDKWQQRYEGSSLYDPENLEFENVLKDKVSVLEKEFDEVNKQVKDKLTAAAALISEANEISQTKGHSLSEMGLSGILEKVMDKAGWNTSSWGC